VAHVTLRFYGRFFYAEAMRGDTPANLISVIAPNFDARQFGRHQALMTVERKQVSFGVAGELTTLPPKLRNVSDVSDITRAESYIWDLSGLRVSYDLAGPVSLTELPQTQDGTPLAAGFGDSRVLDMAELEGLLQRPQPTLRADARQPSADGVSNAVIEVSSGIGTATPVIENGIELATNQEINRVKTLARSNGGVATASIQTIPVPGGTSPFAAVPADLVEFQVPLPADRPQILTLRCHDSTGTEVGIVTVREGTRVAFSNLCSEIRPPQFQDMEFTQYYSLLDGPAKAEVLVPVDVTANPGGGSSEGADCDIQARLRVQLD
jgi:hypothetical protein